MLIAILLGLVLLVCAFFIPSFTVAIIMGAIGGGILVGAIILGGRGG